MTHVPPSEAELEDYKTLTGAHDHLAVVSDTVLLRFIAEIHRLRWLSRMAAPCVAECAKRAPFVSIQTELEKLADALRAASEGK